MTVKLTPEQEKEELKKAIDILKNSSKRVQKVNSSSSARKHLKQKTADDKPKDGGKPEQETEGTTSVNHIIGQMKTLKKMSSEEKASLYKILGSYTVKVIYASNAVINDDKPNIQIEISIGEFVKNVLSVLDSGSDLTFIGISLYREIKKTIEGNIETSLPYPLIIVDANGGESKSYFSVALNFNIKVENTLLEVKNATAYVVDNPEWERTLIGEDILKKLNLMPYQNIAPGVVDLSVTATSSFLDSAFVAKATTLNN